MVDALCELWWMFTLKGLVSITFAFTCYFFSFVVALRLLRPIGFLYLLVVVTFYICLFGIILLVGAIYAFDAKLRHRWLLLVDAILNLAIGPAFLMTFGFGLTFPKVVVLFGLHAMIVGAVYCTLALHHRRYLFLATTGIWPVASGILLIVFRYAPEKMLIAGVAIYAVVLGLLLLLLSAKMRSAKRLREASALQLNYGQR